MSADRRSARNFSVKWRQRWRKRQNRRKTDNHLRHERNIVGGAVDQEDSNQP